MSDLFFKTITSLFRYLPFKGVYGLSNMLYTLLYRIVKYRYKVIHDNIKGAFPEKSNKEIALLIKEFYLNFSDILVETLKGLSINKKTIMERYRFVNAGLLDKDFEAGRNIIMLASHHTNWEWAVLSINLWLEHQVVGVYKPMKEKKTDAFFNEKRKRWGLELVSMSKTARALAKRREIPAAFVFIADQTPSDFKNAHWLHFLNKKTAFHHGMDKIARRTNYPVYFATITRVKRGFYEVEFSLLCQTPGNKKEGEITALYAKRLEEMITTDPANWLWSHRRWKMKREDVG